MLIGADLMLQCDAMTKSTSPGLAACTADETCASWNFDGAGTPTEHGNCTLSALVPPAYNAWNYYHVEGQSTVPGDEVVGAASGVKGAWSSSAGSDCMMLDRPGTHAQAGNLSMCASSEGGTIANTPSFCTARGLPELWSAFKADGRLGSLGADTAPFGGAAITMTIPPRGNASATISMGWFFPHRDWAQSGGPPVTVGNHYTSLFSSSEVPARALLDNADAVADVGNWSAYASALTRSSLPEWYGQFRHRIWPFLTRFPALCHRTRVV